MLSDEEKQAIENLKIEYKKLMKEDNILFPLYKSNAKRLIDLIEKQSKEIEHQIEKRENQKKELAILNAKQIEFNKLVNTVNSYKGQFKRQQKEIEELKDKCKELIFEKQELTSALLDSTPNDKIKAKIEELDIEIQCCEYADDDTEEYKKDIEKEKIRLLRDKKVLQSLLEKE